MYIRLLRIKCRLHENYSQIWWEVHLRRSELKDYFFLNEISRGTPLNPNLSRNLFSINR